MRNCMRSKHMSLHRRSSLKISSQLRVFAKINVQLCKVGKQRRENLQLWAMQSKASKQLRVTQLLTMQRVMTDYRIAEFAHITKRGRRVVVPYVLQLAAQEVSSIK